MGVQKNFDGDEHENKHINSISNTDPLLNTSYYGDTSSSTEDDEIPANNTSVTILPTISMATPRASKVKKKASKTPKPILHVKNVRSKRSQGHRQARRHENMCFLINLAKDLDEDFAEININDLAETSISAFGELLLNRNKMKIWNEFIELSEFEQERIIKMTANTNRRKNNRQERIYNDRRSNSRSSNENFETFVLIGNCTAMNDDHKSTHSLNRQEEANICFHRIDSNIRHILKNMRKRHHLPFDRISWLEADIIPFFKEHPDSVYLRDLDNGFDRMLLHAVCQYLNLISKSFTKDGERYTQVENRRTNFVPPITLLSEYVQSLSMER